MAQPSAVDLFTGKLILAPLAGITNSIYRRICRSMGADIVVSEMVSADGLVRNNRKSDEYTHFEEDERPFGIQLFGSEPETMAEAARWIQRVVRPDFIDINCGCPVRKVVRRNGGSALMKDPEHLERLAVAVVNAVELPVSVKIRSGWNVNQINAAEVAKRIQNAGAAAVTVHPRTREQGFAGKADWSHIKKVRDAVTIPVIGNGDIREAADARRMMDETGCASVMIGRGALGNPWIFRKIKAGLAGGTAEPVSKMERARTCLHQLDEMIREYGDRKGVYDMRKHFSWYLAGMGGASTVRKRIFSEESPEAIRNIIRGYLLNDPNAELYD